MDAPDSKPADLPRQTRQSNAAGTDLLLHSPVHSRWAGRHRPAPAFDANAGADLGVSRTTALLALEQLRAEGYVVARRGSGMFIAPQLPERRPRAVPPLENLVARPPFSRRGAALARMRAPDRRKASSAPCAFRLGTPALDLFPLRIWSQLTRECLRALKPSQLDYSQLAGLRVLREAIAEQVQSRGTRCDADQVQVVMGAQRGLDLIAHMLLDPGDSAGWKIRDIPARVARSRPPAPT